MTSDKQVLVVDSADGALDLVMEELSELGFRVIWTPTLMFATCRGAPSGARL